MRALAAPPAAAGLLALLAVVLVLSPVLLLFPATDLFCLLVSHSRCSNLPCFGGGTSRVFVGGEWLTIPSAPAKYDKFLRARASIFREISNMLQLTEHPNILRLHEVGSFGSFVRSSDRPSVRSFVSPSVIPFVIRSLGIVESRHLLSPCCIIRTSTTVAKDKMCFGFSSFSWAGLTASDQRDRSSSIL